MAYEAVAPYLGQPTPLQLSQRAHLPLTIPNPPTDENTYTELAPFPWQLEPFLQPAILPTPPPHEFPSHWAPSPATTCESLNSFHPGGERFRSPPLTPKSSETPRGAWEVTGRLGGYRPPEVVESTDSLLAFCGMERNAGAERNVPNNQPEEESALNPLINLFHHGSSHFWQYLPQDVPPPVPPGVLPEVTPGTAQLAPPGALSDTTPGTSQLAPPGAITDVTPGTSQLDGYQQSPASSVLTAADLLGTFQTGGTLEARFPRIATPPAWVNPPPLHEVLPVPPSRQTAFLFTTDDASPAIAHEAKSAHQATIAHQAAAAHQTAPTDQSAITHQTTNAHQTKAARRKAAAHQIATAHQITIAHQITSTYPSPIAYETAAAHQIPIAHQTEAAHRATIAHQSVAAQLGSYEPRQTVADVNQQTARQQQTNRLVEEALGHPMPAPTQNVDLSDPAATLNTLRSLVDAPTEVLEQFLEHMVRTNYAMGGSLPQTSPPPRPMPQSTSLQDPLRLQSLSDPRLLAEMLQETERIPSNPPESAFGGIPSNLPESTFDRAGEDRNRMLEEEFARLQKRTSFPAHQPSTGQSLVNPPDSVLEGLAQYGSPGTFSVAHSVVPSHNSPAATSTPDKHKPGGRKHAGNGKADARAPAPAPTPNPPNPNPDSNPENLMQTLVPYCRGSPKRNWEEQSADMGGTGAWRTIKRPRDVSQMELQQVSYSSGGVSPAGSMSRTAHPFEGEGWKEKETNDEATENRNRRIKQLRVQRARACGCTQDWPNDVQELREVCNTQSRDLFSCQLQLKSMNRRDSQQIQQIEDLRARVDKLQCALADARAREGGHDVRAQDGVRAPQGRGRWGFGKGF